VDPGPGSTCFSEFWTRSWYVQNGSGQARGCRPGASRARHFGFTRGGRFRDATDHYGAGDKRLDPRDCWPRRPADSRLRTGEGMTRNPDTSLTDRNRKGFPMNNEQIIRRAYELAEKVDVKGWVECYTPDGTFTDMSIGVTYRGPDGPTGLGKTVEVY